MTVIMAITAGITVAGITAATMVACGITVATTMAITAEPQRAIKAAAPQAAQLALRAIWAAIVMATILVRVAAGRQRQKVQQAVRLRPAADLVIASAAESRVATTTT